MKDEGGIRWSSRCVRWKGNVAGGGLLTAKR